MSPQMTFIIDSMTWFVLVPMLMANPDPVKVAEWKALLFCFSSYMQHGGNAAMALGDFVLNDIPGLWMWGNAWVCFWTSLFGVWSTLFYIRTGRFIYPFLDAHRPNAWVGYLGLYCVHWMAFFSFIGLIKLKEWLRTSWSSRKLKKK